MTYSPSTLGKMNLAFCFFIFIISHHCTFNWHSGKPLISSKNVLLSVVPFSVPVQESEWGVQAESWHGYWGQGEAWPGSEGCTCTVVCRQPWNEPWATLAENMEPHLPEGIFNLFSSLSTVPRMRVNTILLTRVLITLSTPLSLLCPSLLILTYSWCPGILFSIFYTPTSVLKFFPKGFICQVIAFWL